MLVSRNFSRKKAAYLPVGLAAILATVAALLIGGGGRRLIEWISSRDVVFSYSTVTGFLLVTSLLWQWRLYFARRCGCGRKLQREYKRHRWSGIVPLGLLVLHIGGPNASLLSIISYVLVVSSLSGLLNNEIVRQKTNRLRRAWIILHVGSSSVILPLAILHMWAAFAFKG